MSDRPNDPFSLDLEYLVDGVWVSEEDLTDEQAASWLNDTLGVVTARTVPRQSAS